MLPVRVVFTTPIYTWWCILFAIMLRFCTNRTVKLSSDVISWCFARPTLMLVVRGGPDEAKGGQQARTGRARYFLTMYTLSLPFPPPPPRHPHNQPLPPTRPIFLFRLRTRQIFLPTDEAFETAGITTDSVNSLPRPVLTNLLLYHLLEGAADSKVVSTATDFYTVLKVREGREGEGREGGRQGGRAQGGGGAGQGRTEGRRK